MRVHHINAGTMCPFVGDRMVCHCLVVETRDGLALVDSGIGLGDMAALRQRMGWGFTNVARPRADPDDTAVRRIERLGFHASDVRHILVTHLDLDHAGGIPDFPGATVHAYRPEHDAAHARATYNEKNRYRPHQLRGAKWALHEPDGQGDGWFGFAAVKPLLEDLAIVPLVGHTRGHAAIAVRDDAGWMLHCGDAYFNAAEMDVEKPSCPLPLRLFQRVIAMDDAARRANQDRLRALVRDHGRQVRVFCAHDASELERETQAPVSAQPRAAASA
jgi:glyoxylase-like metal-dependent hydrolase (beta-lactamase superfamily II)